MCVYFYICVGACVCIYCTRLLHVTWGEDVSNFSLCGLFQFIWPRITWRWESQLKISRLIKEERGQTRPLVWPELSGCKGCDDVSGVEDMAHRKCRTLFGQQKCGLFCRCIVSLFVMSFSLFLSLLLCRAYTHTYSKCTQEYAHTIRIDAYTH